MAKYLLDTNTIVYLEDKELPFYEAVFNRISALKNEDEVYIPILALFELQYGKSYASPHVSKKISKIIISIEKRFPVLPLTKAGSEIFGELKALYRMKTGISKKAITHHNIDFMLASSAMAEGAILVSNDTIFQTIHKENATFLFENWTL